MHKVCSGCTPLNFQILEKLAQSKPTQSSVAKHFVVFQETIQNVTSNKELIRRVEIGKHSHKRYHLKFKQKHEDVIEATYQ